MTPLALFSRYGDTSDVGDAGDVGYAGDAGDDGDAADAQTETGGEPGKQESCIFGVVWVGWATGRPPSLQTKPLQTTESEKDKKNMGPAAFED